MADGKPVAFTTGMSLDPLFEQKLTPDLAWSIQRASFSAPSTRNATLLFQSGSRAFSSHIEEQGFSVAVVGKGINLLLRLTRRPITVSMVHCGSTLRASPSVIIPREEPAVVGSALKPSPPPAARPSAKWLSLNRRSRVTAPGRRARRSCRPARQIGRFPRPGRRFRLIGAAIGGRQVRAGAGAAC